MGVIRDGGVITSHNNAVRAKESGIIVKCPKCQGDISVTGFRNDEPVRCPKCAYPLVTRADMLQIIAACAKPDNAGQVGSAVGILKRLADFVPEAGTALGSLAGKYTLPISEQERWEKLVDAYAAGDENAKEGLNRMCQSNPEMYGHKLCSHCGAHKYFIKRKNGEPVCVYCRRSE